MRTKRVIILFLVFIPFIVIHCGNSDRNKIEDVLSKRQRAFETKNVELYMSCISPTYRQEKNGKVIGFEEIKRNFLTNVSLFDQIKVSHYDRNIYNKGKRADAAQKTRVEVRIEEDNSRFQLSENIVFEKINGEWKIIKESDADFLKGFVFGGIN
jgi:outer membrane lipoprotein-sorting protein